jgi:hypothetical protein
MPYGMVRQNWRTWEGTVTGKATGVKEVRASRDGREAKGAIVADTDRRVKEKVTTREDTTRIR